ncbi:RNA polymerase III subunit RPC82-domain-containing protein [Lipomyces orientalis]|uniref:RNA polymerase III subunit RPC82-domain-containing protein n=1 Tax=Lipomyces orientalis TaxID=1233043 RepID=A0ACC3TWZ0_9ASCO
MSQYEKEFVILLLRDIYGDIAATVVDTLLKYGRLTLQLISRYSKVPTSTIQRALVPLVQNRFVLYWVDNNAGGENTTYVASTRNMYNMVRSGAFVSYVLDRFPDAAGAPDIIKNLLLYGHIRASDYLAAQSTSQAVVSRNALTLLLQHKLLTTLKRHEFNHESDLYMRIFKRRLAAIPRSKTVSEAKREVQAHAEAREEFQVLKRIHDDINDGLVAAANTTSNGTYGNKGYLVSESLPSKTVDESAVLALNYDKFAVLMRAQILVQLVSKRIGNVTAAVYRQVLDCMEPKLFRCVDNSDKAINVTSLEILRRLDADIELGSALVARSSRKRSRSSSSRISKRQKRNHDREGSVSGSDDSMPGSDNFDIDSNRNGDDKRGDRDNSEHDDDDSADDTVVTNSRVEHLNFHLALLSCNQNLPFLKKVGNKGGGEWTIDFGTLTARVRELEYDSLITQKEGPIACRLLRIIREKGRIDEKQLAQIALLPPKDIRSHLTALHEIGCLDLQEVPRGTDRAPSRTYYFWYHKPMGAYALMTQAVLKTIVRCYARVVEERGRRPGVMSKLLREDVRRDEANMLTPAEKEEVRRVRGVEERFIAHMMKLDRLVLIFRDM